MPASLLRTQIAAATVSRPITYLHTRMCRCGRGSSSVPYLGKTRILSWPTYDPGVAWIRRMPARQMVGIGLVAVGTALTVALAFVGGARKAATQEVDALLVLMIAVTQVGAAWAFNGIGRADPSLATRSAARLFWLARKAHSSGEKAQSVFEDGGDPNELKMRLGIAATDFSWLEEGLVQSVDDWRIFHEEAVGRAEGEQSDNG
jgi:hypothetical protein